MQESNQSKEYGKFLLLETTDQRSRDKKQTSFQILQSNSKSIKLVKKSFTFDQIEEEIADCADDAIHVDFAKCGHLRGVADSALEHLKGKNFKLKRDWF